MKRTCLLIIILLTIRPAGAHKIIPVVPYGPINLWAGPGLSATYLENDMRSHLKNRVDSESSDFMYGIFLTSSIDLVIGEVFDISGYLEYIPAFPCPSFYRTEAWMHRTSAGFYAGPVFKAANSSFFIGGGLQHSRFSFKQYQKSATGYCAKIYFVPPMTLEFPVIKGFISFDTTATPEAGFTMGGPTIKIGSELLITN